MTAGLAPHTSNGPLQYAEGVGGPLFARFPAANSSSRGTRQSIQAHALLSGLSRQGTVHLRRNTNPELTALMLFSQCCRYLFARSNGINSGTIRQAAMACATPLP